MSVNQQICVNHIQLPEELLKIIKDFAFLDIVSFITKTRKKSIDRLIECSKWTGDFYYFRNNFYNCVICIGEDVNSPEFLINFCKKCGNYIFYRSIQNQKINCLC